jgi:hypothetical protein
LYRLLFEHTTTECFALRSLKEMQSGKTMQASSISSNAAQRAVVRHLWGPPLPPGTNYKGRYELLTFESLQKMVVTTPSAGWHSDGQAIVDNDDMSDENDRFAGSELLVCSRCRRVFYCESVRPTASPREFPVCHS